MSCMEDADFALALRLQEEENRLAGIPSGSSGLPTGGRATPNSQKWATGDGPALSSQKGAKGVRKGSSPARSLPPPGTSLVDESYELIDPTPDIYQLFRDFNKHFFWGKLGGVELKWSPRMTRCAGVCSYQPASGMCSVRLSRPLLTLRPRSDLVETLLHEMIHALLFVTHNIDNREEHGPEFHRHMHRINKIAGTKISVYHTFHDEVRHMLTHWWRCEGPCRRRPPHFGFVKRSMNRAPGKNDFWWRDHQASCGGTFEKIKEPEAYRKKKGIKETAFGAGKKLQDIRNFVVNGKATPLAKKPAKRPSGATKPVPVPPTAGSGRPQGHPGRLGGSPSPAPAPASGSHRTPTTRQPTWRPATAGPLGDRPGKRPAAGSGGPSSQKRPPGNPTGVRPNIGTVNNGGNQRVNNIANNVHGFQKTAGRGGRGGAVAMAGGSRTVTVPPRRGGGGGGGGAERVGGGEGVDSAFGGRGCVLGGARSVPWYKRHPPPAAPRPAPAAATAAPAASASRPPTGIFLSPETTNGPIPATFSAGEDSDSVEAAPDTVTCPVCGRKVNLQGINDHVDLCLVAGCEREGSPQPGLGSDAVWADDEAEELMMSHAADALETSLETPSWEENAEDDEMLADAANQLETSLKGRDAAEGDRDDTYNGKRGDGGAAARSPASDASTVYDELLDGESGATARSPASDSSTVYDEPLDVGSGKGAVARSPSSVSTVYDEILDGPIVIDSSDDEEDYASQRANLSDVIKEFIKVEESDDELFDE